MVRHCPIEGAILEVANTLVIDSVTDADVDTVGGQHAVDLSQHLGCVGARAISAKDRVEGALVKDGVKNGVLVLELTDVHLFVDEGRVAVLVQLGHLLHDGERDVDVADVLVAILVHLFRQTYRQHRLKLANVSFKINQKRCLMQFVSDNYNTRFESDDLEPLLSFAVKSQQQQL